MADLLTLAEVYRRLDGACQAAGSQSAFAAQVGVTPQFVSAVLRGHKAPSSGLLATLGLRQVVRFVVTKGGASVREGEALQAAADAA